VDDWNAFSSEILLPLSEHRNTLMCYQPTVDLHDVVVTLHAD